MLGYIVGEGERQAAEEELDKQFREKMERYG